MLFNYRKFLVYFVHQGKNHFLTNIFSNGVKKHPMCHPLEHQSQIKIMVSSKIAHIIYITH
jgi:hypothetical protein